MIGWLLACGGVNAPVSPDEVAVVEIEATSFLRGLPEEEPGPYGQRWQENELPEHEVEISSYAIDTTEVTVAMWAAFLNAGDAHALHHHPLQPVTWEGTFQPAAAESSRPIRQVSYFDATVYCAWVGKRLPTEAEWELAAKGVDNDRRWPWGDEAPDCERAVFATGQTLCEDKPDTVGSRGEAGLSARGLADMAGNVSEWVVDHYGPYGSEALVDPVGPEEGAYRILRGGGFREGPDSLRVTARYGADPTQRSEGVGFRCAEAL